MAFNRFYQDILKYGKRFHPKEAGVKELYKQEDRWRIGFLSLSCFLPVFLLYDL